MSISSLKKKVRKRIGPYFQTLAYRTGAMKIMARMRHIKGAVALMYHSVADESHARWIDPRDHVPSDIFEQQIAFLSKRKNVISLSELTSMLLKNKTPNNGTIVITFDDGYLDNLTVAAPVLDRYGLTATLFLPTGVIDRAETQWVDVIYSVFKFRRKNELTWYQDIEVKFDLEDRKQESHCYRVVCNSLLSASAEKRKKYLNTLIDQLRPSELPPRLTMTWDDVNTLLTDYQCFQIGGHTIEHTDMTGIVEHDARQELRGCIQRIEEVTGMQPQNFSFPYGRTNDRLRKIAAEVGFKSAFGGDGADPVITKKTDIYALPRVEAPASMKHLDLLIDTANTGIWRRMCR